MRKTRIEILLISLTVLALGAGLAAGLLAARLPGAAANSAAITDPGGSTSASSGATSSGAAAPGDPNEASSLVGELQLTPQQRDQMRQIWEAARGQVHQAYDEAERLQKDRDDAIAAFLTDEQKAQFQEVSKDFAGRFVALRQKRDRTFEEAVEKTRSILNDVQRQKYEQILRRHVGPDGPGTQRSEK